MCTDFVKALAIALVLGIATVSTASAQVQSVSVPHTASIPLDIGSETFEVDIELLSLPARPRVRAIATPDPAHADMTLDVEITDCVANVGFMAFPNDPTFCNDFFDWSSGQDPGVAEAVAELWECNPFPPNSKLSPPLCRVRVTALDFGTANAPPATIDLEIKGETRIVTGSVDVELDLSPRSPVTLVIEGASKDATLFEGADSSSGGGQTLIAGDWTEFVFGIPIGTFERRALLAFDLEDDLGNPIPFGADILDASLTLNVLQTGTAGQTVNLFRVDPSKNWGEGTNAPSPLVSFGAPADEGDATWDDYRFSSTSPLSWDTPGGDFVPSISASVDVATVGPHTWSGPGLVADIEDMIDVLPTEPSQNQGWILLGPTGGGIETPFRFDSTQSLDPQKFPTLTVEYQENIVAQGNLEIEAVNFILDHDNFRWIYDDDGDAVVETVDPVTSVVQGSCRTINDSSIFTPPFAYTFLGDSSDPPDHDCCVWTGISETTGTNECGQAVIYLAVPTTVPVPDWDSDGIGNPCDNCINIPNGPDLGTCVPASNEADGLTRCLSDQDCLAGDTCSLAQEDDDGNRVGDACPEPGSTVLVATGLLGLAGLAGRRPRAHNKSV